MDEEFNDVVDDTPVDDAPVDDVPVDDTPEIEDVPEDIPEDIPEDVPEDIPEDIPEDVPEDIPEDIPEDVPEDVPEDIPEDVPEDVPEDTQSDVADEAPTSETEDTAPDANADEQPADDQSDVADEAPAGETEDTTPDANVDEQPADMQDDMADEAPAGETEDTAPDANADEQPADTQEDAADEAPTAETADTAPDANADEQPADTQDDVAYETPATETEDTVPDVSADEQPADTETADALENKNQDNNDNFNDAVNDADDKKKYSDLSDKVQYLDKMRNDAESALSYDPARKDDWDVVRGRLSDEYKSAADSLKDMGATKQAEYDKLKDEYFATDALPDSPEKAAKLQDLANRGRELGSEIDSINSRARYADTLSQDLARGLDPSKKTSYTGVGGKDFTDIHQNMIQKQGNAVPDFRGTCGDCSAANTMNALGDTKTEAEVVQRARALKACVDKPVPKFMPEKMKNQIRGSNGGTSVAGRSKILDSFGYDCDNRQGQSLSDIANQLENGKGAIINVDHRVLNKQNDVSLLNPMGTDHALTITGIEKDASGNPIGLWIHDTGVCSNMGNAFYCNANDYATWKNTPNCTVQYVTKR